ncbi:hypothetical protein [Treponema sp.]|uniref:hypothetical protein n=1 Tax=Treponema sp. TaxID=166 RepID=UPI003F10798E
MKEHRMKKKIICLLMGFAASGLFAFDEKNILSPVSGVWKNKQALVLNPEKGTDVYYSFSGMDPYVSGFFYDAPVLIDQAQDVVVNIAAISQDGTRKDFSIKYSVEENSASEYSEQSKKFVDAINENPLVPYVSGTDFSIPQEFMYSLDRAVPPYLNSVLSLSVLNSAERFVPCFVSDSGGANLFCFVLHVLPRENELSVESDSVPFEISDWSNISFKDKNYIYKIDDGNWKSPSEISFIDRSEAHKIFWQPLEFQPGNTVFEYTLPEKPSVVSSRNANGSMEFLIQGNEKFTFEKNASSVVAEAFNNEEVSSLLSLKIFYNGNYQGCEEVSFEADRLPPKAPEIVSMASGKFIRKPLFKILSEPDTDVYYALSSPIEIPDGFIENVQNKFEKAKTGKFVLYNGSKISFKAKNDNAVLYKIRAYAVDAAGNKSEISEQKIFVDEINYYLSSEARTEMQDGSYDNPFSSFEQFVSVLNSAERKLRLHVYGNIEIPDREVLISRACSVVGHDAVLRLESNAVLKIENALAEFENLFFEKKSRDKSQPVILSLNSTVKISNCELSAVFEKSGLLIDLKNSSASLENSGFTILAASYACGLSAENSKISSGNSRWTSTGDSCFNAKIFGGSASFRNSSFSLIGISGRGIQFVDGRGSVRENEFFARLSDSTSRSEPVWSNTNSVAAEKNIQRGF